MIGKRIKLLRRNASMNQQELGELLGIGQRAISSIESGVNQPTIAQIEILCERFGVTSDYIIFGNTPLSRVKNQTERRVAA